MNGIEKAINRAKEGGYPESNYCQSFDMYQSESNYCTSSVLLEPEFWKALGKVEGWSKEKIGVCEKCGGRTPRECNCDLYFEPTEIIDEWLYHWHAFIDHISEGKDIGEFFDKILK